MLNLMIEHSPRKSDIRIPRCQRRYRQPPVLLRLCRKLLLVGRNQVLGWWTVPCPNWHRYPRCRRIGIRGLDVFS